MFVDYELYKKPNTIPVTKNMDRTVAAARALMTVDEMSAEEVAQKAMDVASDMCVYTNKEFLSYTLDDVGETPEEES